jgi:hypothetical protein
MKTEETNSSETSDFLRTTRCYNTASRSLHSQNSDKLQNKQDIGICKSQVRSLQGEYILNFLTCRMKRRKYKGNAGIG